jgi:type I restriction enzyme S subunit
VLQACDREIVLLERKRELLKQQKQGLMQQLLTGRVRVDVDPIAA